MSTGFKKKLKELLNKSAMQDIRDDFFERQGKKRRNTGNISSFLTVSGNKPAGKIR